MFPETAKKFEDLFDKNGKPVALDEVYVSQWKGKDSGKFAPVYGGGKGERFGPDHPFGIYMHEKYCATQITPQEEEILKNDVSDGGFHCLVSAKIMCGLAKVFAEVMLALQNKEQR